MNKLKRIPNKQSEIKNRDHFCLFSVKTFNMLLLTSLIFLIAPAKSNAGGFLRACYAAIIGVDHDPTPMEWRFLPHLQRAKAIAWHPSHLTYSFQQLRSEVNVYHYAPNIEASLPVDLPEPLRSMLIENPKKFMVVSGFDKTSISVALYSWPYSHLLESELSDAVFITRQGGFVSRSAPPSAHGNIDSKRDPKARRGMHYRFVTDHWDEFSSYVGKTFWGYSIDHEELPRFFRDLERLGFVDQNPYTHPGIELTPVPESRLRFRIEINGRGFD